MARRRVRHNPHSSAMPILLLGGGLLLGATGVFGETFKATLRTLGHDISSTFGGRTLTTPGGPASGTEDCSIITTVHAGDLPALAALALSQGVTDPNNPAAIPFGRTLWAWQHPEGPNPCAYNHQPQNVQASWNSYAIHGR